MIESVPFQTRARTIDHLGREQIADCPTAVSELWKNAYDAYARNVSLDVFDGDIPTAVICDDGHGMTLQEIKEKWLVVGTESKALNSTTLESNRNGLAIRPKQGQKGIGRLSCGYLGSLLLLVSKSKNEPYAVALIDWRLFENPYLFLQDISIPVASFENKEDILPGINQLFDKLMGNIWGDSQSENEARNLRIKQAWDDFDKLEESRRDPSLFPQTTTRESLENTLTLASFTERNFQEWALWNDTHDTGTALLIANINSDLKCLLKKELTDSISKQGYNRFFSTLTSFSDPFKKQDNGGNPDEFNCTASAWVGQQKTIIVGKVKSFSLSDLLHLEHIVDGTIDENGTFIGKVKTFGKWYENIEVKIPSDLQLPKRSDTLLGSFELFIATAEILPGNTTHSKDDHAKIMSLAKKYAGFMLYRDGLRVLPYGRPDNDFFEIEQRRSKNAGLYFWNHRRMFGKVGITKSANPNLRDKAGREGLVDNRAAKALKDVIENILTQTAERYFGRTSPDRKERLPEIRAAHKNAKDEEAKKALRKKKRKEFCFALKKNESRVESELKELQELRNHIAQTVNIDDEHKILSARTKIEAFKSRKSDYQLGEAPKKLGTLEERYLNYRNNFKNCQQLASDIEETIITALEDINPRAPHEIVLQDLQRQDNNLNRRISIWAKRLKEILQAEDARINEFIKSRKKLLQNDLTSLVDDVEHRRVPLKRALKLIENKKEALDSENQELFEPYISALECLQENIDLQSLASSTSEEALELRDELNRLNELAQLGITVEIVGHELESFDATIGSGLSHLPIEVKETKAYKQIELGYHGLTERLRFLSPLKLSGDKTQNWISARNIEDYTRQFFAQALSERKVTLDLSEAFLKFKIYDLPSRIYTVFINLINNSIYWVSQIEGERKVLIDYVNGKVVIADNGPGVEEEDIPRLFTLFFTRKIRGGRGVGLYLCRANLAASGHRIEYIKKSEDQLLEGANFSIEFKGAQI